eukprot:CAMPEP_0174317596 /NCGR_PEP_ID=MMETSP0810-20121108/7679_1 /TAXON_ID=73025 ORGANISM="Eutreptiella gymnastica-like, Strain CCMP1594" /NCGR_SAMPLE_ID=MMETSP0810 /ASSEMBLY_ACC=CAM_ASM_000659 /LENGTH=86 /DNA_ID=CAMNT_0015427609 /DNA_START=1821 /DNA_END=2081 /DNA_ORIENTATION=+
MGRGIGHDAAWRVPGCGSFEHRAPKKVWVGGGLRTSGHEQCGVIVFCGPPSVLLGIIIQRRLCQGHDASRRQYHALPQGWPSAPFR